MIACFKPFWLKTPCIYHDSIRLILKKEVENRDWRQTPAMVSFALSPYGDLFFILFTGMLFAMLTL